MGAGDMRAIGGFLPLEPCSGKRMGGVLSLWGIADRNAWKFVNARSALAHLIQVVRAQRLLLPALICPELAQAAREAVTVDYYPLNARFSPNIEALSGILQPGDCVVGVDYFGRQPESDFQALVRDRNDVVWVEDRAQAMLPAPEPWAEWVLYSPRKLFGVSDGGILVSACRDVVPAEYSEEDSEARLMPRILRRDDYLERDNAVWYAAYQEAEARMSVSREPMSAKAFDILGNIDTELVIRRRKQNFDALAEYLAEFALFRERVEDFVPFGFPVRVRHRDRVLNALSDRRIFAPRYWPHLPSDPAAFPAEHGVSRELLLLPCDQRYDEDDMRTVAAEFRDALACHIPM
jgi:hypothetical protein